ncbi:histidine kinase [Paenibacillus sp. BIHB 4019]|uniref:histidine kinase n=1 Tax=Paenibacillus sp. BIHB 4019 TaxID=1870819 RepID=A0A1B2DGI9_9BACL|nr:sensor histidine kinase [Paenibacillus sp. BIHB 4019]ANY66830.1 histidine kinase [Paenibacillus sp. BIHB 4019]
MRKRSIQFLISVALSVFAAAAIIMVSVLLFNKFSQTAETNALRNTQQVVDQVSYNLEDYIQGMSEIYGVLHDTISRSGDVNEEELRSQLNTIIGIRGEIVSLAVIGHDGEVMMSIPGVALKENLSLYNQRWFQSALQTPNHLSYSLPHVQNMYKMQYKWVVSLSKGITVVRGGKTEHGVLLLDVNFNKINQLSSRVVLGKKGYVYIVDESAGNMVYHPQQQLIYAGLKSENVEQALKYTFGSFHDESGDEDKMITVQTIGNIGWKVVGVSFTDEIITTKRELNDYLLNLLLLLLVFVIAMSWLISRIIARPIRQLEKSMKNVERGDFHTMTAIRGPLEVERLSTRFNLMVARIRELMQQIVVEQEAKRKYEFEALQSQINPHFLYNTLNTVVRMVGMNRNEEVVTTITSLSKLFRISLSKGKPMIPLASELEHARNYLIIQNIRFKNKFDYVFDVEEAALPSLSLKLILQPLLENAIMHGIEPSVDKGLITVRAWIEAGQVYLQVSDNGLGMSGEQLAALLTGETDGSTAKPSGYAGDRKADRDGTIGGTASEAPKRPTSANFASSSATSAASGAGSGVGVRNVHERIRLFYGEPYGLQFESELEEGTTVTIRFPFKQAGDEADERSEEG